MATQAAMKFSDDHVSAATAMRLSDLLSACGCEGLLREKGDADIYGLTEDSRRVEKGFLFAAFPGSESDGRDFINDALRRGAAAILTTRDTQMPPAADNDAAVWIQIDNPRALFAQMASAWFPRRPERIVAITGTNGKSSTAFFLRQLWSRLGVCGASIGTLGVHSDARVDTGATLTTLAPVELHRLLQELNDEGVTRVALEASSHGLQQYRLDGLRFNAAAFTGFSQDHLDYHGDMESYAGAKLRLFEERLDPNACAVINADMTIARQAIDIAKQKAKRVITVGFDSNADIAISSLASDPQGQSGVCSFQGARFDFRLNLIGAFQACNALTAAALAIDEGSEATQVFNLMSALESVPGRMEKAAQHNNASIFVDYAHTPDALANVLEAARPHTGGRLRVVFGCGGDRDTSKRAQMGDIARTRADDVIVTDDNPRSENPDNIRREILSACPNAAEIGDRRDAIRHAVASLEPGDILIIAGKGQEQFQIRGKEVIPFSDRDEVVKAVSS